MRAFNSSSESATDLWLQPTGLLVHSYSMYGLAQVLVQQVAVAAAVLGDRWGQAWLGV